ncbi:MAG: amidohydrolase family protein [Candidatus Hydrogenedentes bacterium]|nr:amidohydrolase family protein [Candidatus Hydrogenedentota bacterium]
MPDFPIVDTHLHVWDVGHIDYPWLPDVPLLNKSHLLEDYDRACGAVDVEKMIFVQAEANPVEYKEETRWVTALAKTDPRLQGIISWAPLEKGDGARLDLEELAQNKLVKGIRRIIQYEEDIEFCLQPDFVRGVRLLPKHGFHFELCVNHLQLANTRKLVAQCPEVMFNLNHIGKPNIKQQQLEPWKVALRELAGFENVTCKISGLVTEADIEHWTPQDLQPYIEHVLDCFGFDRIFYGGDWPVAQLASEYPRWVETLEQAVAGCSESELRDLFVNNANRFYRLAP